MNLGTKETERNSTLKRVACPSKFTMLTVIEIFDLN